LLALASLAGGCTKQPPSGTTEAQPSVAPPALTVTEAAPSAAPADPTASAPAEPAASATAPADSGAAVASKLSEWQTEVEGCLALKGAEPPPTRSAPSKAVDQVNVESVSGSLRVAHQLHHACCLNSETRVERAAGIVRLTERLTGTPCRCQCDSTIKTRIRLEAGDRELSVQLEEKGATREVHRAPLPEPGTSVAPKLPKLPKKVQATSPATSAGAPAGSPP